MIWLAGKVRIKFTCCNPPYKIRRKKLLQPGYWRNIFFMKDCSACDVTNPGCGCFKIKKPLAWHFLSNERRDSLTSGSTDPDWRCHQIKIAASAAFLFERETGMFRLRRHGPGIGMLSNKKATVVAYFIFPHSSFLLHARHESAFVKIKVPA